MAVAAVWVAAPRFRLRASAPKTDFCENEFDDEIEDFDRMFGDGI